MSEQAKFSVIVAGGSGTRMKSVIAKQFLPLDDKPILAHTIERFLSIEGNTVIAVLPASDMIFWHEIVESDPVFIKADSEGRLKTVEGGQTRYQSVSNGLAAISKNEGLVAIHDGVRPLVSEELINNAFSEAHQKGSAVPAIPLKDSARWVDDNGNKHIDRTAVRLIQTPQTFDLSLIKKAFALGEQTHFTDDASVIEFAGHKVNLIEGDYRNIKITTPEDLEVAEIFLKNSK
ncbi:2-C-methyl-D-erythritol 4-phosphate cytidylyltransferase [Jiulongibacter sp. NS-SX5]|uniref:2-C-methyl-D-erythritol 4-phosphate cytidylyltransferase n=1 Tax=Jiulongibacter sp. NS-SX5 TaxID=3463854 RepID=UPI004058B4D5